MGVIFGTSGRDGLLMRSNTSRVLKVRYNPVQTTGRRGLRAERRISTENLREHVGITSEQQRSQHGHSGGSEMAGCGKTG